MVICKKNCNKKAYYNYEGNQIGMYCGIHKEDGMIDVVNKQCIFEGCTKRCNYNKEGEKRGIYCKTHKEEGMVDVTHKKCIVEGCTTRPSYNEDGEIIGLYCKNHKEEGMKIVVAKKCIYKGCNTQPVYNNIGEKRGLYCKKHKEKGMVDVMSQKCSYEGCLIHSSYNYKGESKGKYCVTHKEKDMIDVMSKKCAYEGCLISAGYNYEDEKSGKYCASHKEEGMINVKDINKLCKSPLCASNENYEGYCLFCFMYTFPDRPVARNYKTKERAVADFVLKIFPDFTWIIDKTIQDGCSLRRPDLLLDLGYQVVIVEIDENQHNDYDCSCENKRIMQLSLDVNHRPIVFIRFNPDDYLKGEENIISCWGINGNGICVVKKKKEWEERLEILKEEIEYWCEEENQTDKTVEIIQLFYDE